MASSASELFEDARHIRHIRKQLWSQKKAESDTKEAQARKFGKGKLGGLQDIWVGPSGMDRFGHSKERKREMPDAGSGESSWCLNEVL